MACQDTKNKKTGECPQLDGTSITLSLPKTNMIVGNLKERLSEQEVWGSYMKALFSGNK